MTPRRRRLLLATLLLAAASLSWFGRRGPPLTPAGDTLPAAAVARADSDPPPAPAAVSIIALRPRQPTEPPGDAFASQDWTPPPPPPPPAPPPAPPSAPPLPYTVLGKLLQDGQWQVFLARGEQVLIAKPKEVLEERYRVDSTRPPALVLTYLPLHQQQVLPIGDAQ